MFLDSKSKFNVTRPLQTLRPVTADDFFKWTGNHMYRTSYNDMTIKVFC